MKKRAMNRYLDILRHNTNYPNARSLAAALTALLFFFGVVFTAFPSVVLLAISLMGGFSWIMLIPWLAATLGGLIVVFFAMCAKELASVFLDTADAQVASWGDYVTCQK